MIEISYDVALKALKDAVAEKGADYVYPVRDDGDRCVYTVDGKPSCIVGNALVRIGVPVEKLPREEDFQYRAAQQVKELGEGVRVADDAASLFDRAQQWQDGGITWGESVARAVAWESTREPFDF